MILGYILSAISIFGYIISKNFWSYLFFQILVSFSYSMHWAATTIYIAQNTTPENKGRYMGYANTGVFSGSFFGGLFFSFLLTFNQDYYFSMYFLIIFPLISTMLIIFLFNLNNQKSI
jgi:MFS family permease